MTTTTTVTSAPSATSGEVAAGRSVPFVEPALREWVAQLVDQARCDAIELTGENGLLTALVRQVLWTGSRVR